LRKQEEPVQWEVEELKKLSESQPDLVESALRDLWRRNPGLHRSIVISAYLDGKISLGKAAELLGITRWELQSEFLAKGVPLRSLTKEDVLAEVEALRRWKKS
jgi:predicted HTH domain antitoxin